MNVRWISLVVLCASAPAGASIVWRGDFETNDLSQWDSFVVHPERWTFIQSQPTPRQGVYAARVELHADDYGPSNLIRTEVGHTPASLGVFQNTERYYAWSNYVSTDFPLGAFDHQLMFWECDAPVYQQEMSLHVNADNVSFATSPQGGSYQTQWQGKLPGGQWHDFVLHVMWSLDPAVGFVELWYDGKWVLPKFMMRTMHATKDSNGNDLQPLTSTFHHGLFLGAFIAGKPVEVVYLDNVLEGTTLADVMPATGLDAGATDAGASDAGPPTDAGRPTQDGGAPADAGTPAPPDAGASSPGRVNGGCGCGPSDGGWGLLAALAAGLASLKRRRRRT